MSISFLFRSIRMISMLLMVCLPHTGNCVRGRLSCNNKLHVIKDLKKKIEINKTGKGKLTCELKS